MSAAAFGWGVGFATLGEAAGWDPLAAPLSLLVPVAAFGSARRGEDLPRVLAGAAAVAYAAYAGLALVRALRPEYAAPFVRIAGDGIVLAVAFVAGIPFALLLAVAVALPFAIAPRPRDADTRASARFWSVVRRSLRARAGPLAPDGRRRDDVFDRRRA